MISEDSQTPELTTIFSPTGEPISEEFKAILGQVAETLAAQVVQSGEAASIMDLATEPTDPELSPQGITLLAQHGISNVYVVPVRMQGRVIGTLSLYRCGSKPPRTTADQLLLQNLADRAALAINNAYLYADLKDALEAEQSLRNQIIQVEKFSAVGRMVASIAHEMNNPLQTVKNCLFLIRRELTDKNGSAYLDMASSEIQRISRLVSQLREIYRPRTSGKLQPVKISQVLDDVSALIESHLQREHVVLERTTQEDPVSVEAVADQLMQVFLNISLNAIEAMQPDGGMLAITLQVEPEKKLVGIVFKDTGPGIPIELMPKLFQPLFTTKEFGLGLGLSISNDIVQRLGGRIDVDSQPGNGAIFTVWLPVSQTLPNNSTSEE